MTNDPHPAARRPGPTVASTPALRRRLRPDPPTAAQPAVRRPRPDGPDRPGAALRVPTLRRRLRPALVPLVVTVGVLVAVAAVVLGDGAGGAGTGGPGRPAAASAAAPAVGRGVAVLQGEIAALEAGGLPADHPKVQLLRDDLTSLERGAARPVVPEPGVDVGARLAGDSARDGTGAATGGAGDFDDGPVACEPLPGGLLTPADIDGAECSSTLTPDGGSLYVAERPDGSTTAVRFAPDGSIEVTGTVTGSP